MIILFEFKKNTFFFKVKGFFNIKRQEFLLHLGLGDHFAIIIICWYILYYRFLLIGSAENFKNVSSVFKTLLYGTKL